MAPSEFPNIQPPDPNKIRKPTGGSFVKRNSWLIAVVIAVILIGAGVWFVIGKVKTLKSRYHVDRVSLDTAKDQKDNDDDVTDDDTTQAAPVGTAKDSVFMESYNTAIKSATLNISGDAAAYKLEDTTNLLFIAETRSRHNKYQFDGHRDGSSYIMNFKIKHVKGNSNWNNSSDTAKIKLNVNPEWNITVDAGAVDLDFDLSKYKLKSLKLNGGAGAFKLRIGQPLATTDIVVSTGASDVTIKIPEDAACSIETTSGLSSSTFSGFVKKDDHHYQTPNFSANENKILIKFSGGISDYKVYRY